MKTSRLIISDYRSMCADAIEAIGEIYRNYTMGLITHREVKYQVIDQVSALDALRVDCIRQLSENGDFDGEKLLESLEDSGLLEAVSW